jgi:hypothetical protein
MPRRRGTRCSGRNKSQFCSLFEASGCPNAIDPGAGVGIEGRPRYEVGAAAYSQGTERVMPTEGKNFLQSRLFAVVSWLAVSIFFGTAPAASASEMDEFSV